MGRKPTKRTLKPQPPKKVDANLIPDRILAPEEIHEEFRCVCCGHKYKRQKNYFSVTKSPVFAGNNGYLPICKSCIGQLFDKYTDFFGGDEEQALERMCQLTDMYVDETAWVYSRKAGADANRMSDYMARLNIVPEARGKTYSDTIVKRFEESEEQKAAAEAKAAEEERLLKTVEGRVESGVDEEVVRRFGPGFDSGDYDVMQYEYNTWVDQCGSPIDKRQEELYVTICGLKLNLQKSIQSNANNIGTVANSYKSFIEAATTEIEDRKKKAEAEAANNYKPLGVMIRDIENYTPAEFYKDKKLYRDADGIKQYIERHLLRPLRNLLTGSRELDKEYRLDDGDGEKK